MVNDNDEILFSNFFYWNSVFEKQTKQYKIIIIIIIIIIKKTNEKLGKKANLVIAINILYCYECFFFPFFGLVSVFFFENHNFIQSFFLHWLDIAMIIPTKWNPKFFFFWKISEWFFCVCEDLIKLNYLFLWTRKEKIIQKFDSKIQQENFDNKNSREQKKKKKKEMNGAKPNISNHFISCFLPLHC